MVMNKLINKLTTINQTCGKPNLIFGFRKLNWAAATSLPTPNYNELNPYWMAGFRVWALAQT